MSTWDYRVVRRALGDEEQFDVREIYYDDDGKIEMWARESVGPGGDTLDELRTDLRLMAEAVDRPVVEYDDLPGRPKGESDSRAGKRL